ncbi:MAG: YdcF family protein [Candidatus Yanofskybacteria bacterium]|nr:YdcF family protein [Candidatus Yanofskybacteria bacterium]
MRIARLVIVNGYGCDLDSPLKQYLDAVVAFLDENPSCVVFTGGQTQRRSFPGMSEASVMASYVRSQVPDLECVLEDRSYTTYDNIRNAAMLVREKGWEPDRILIFCEATRALKVMLLARHFFKEWWDSQSPVLPNRERRLQMMTSSWELMHPASELFATVWDWVALTFPFLNEMRSQQRHEKSFDR